MALFRIYLYKFMNFNIIFAYLVTLYFCVHIVHAPQLLKTHFILSSTPLPRNLLHPQELLHRLACPQPKTLHSLQCRFIHHQNLFPHPLHKYPLASSSLTNHKAGAPLPLATCNLMSPPPIASFHGTHPMGSVTVMSLPAPSHLLSSTRP